MIKKSYRIQQFSGGSSWSEMRMMPFKEEGEARAELDRLRTQYPEGNYRLVCTTEEVVG